jgi:hypothetical protein
MLVFTTQLCDLYSPLLTLSLLSGSTLPPPHLLCVNKYTVLIHVYTIQCVGVVVMGFWASDADKVAQFFQMTTFCIAFCESYLSTVRTLSQSYKV